VTSFGYRAAMSLPFMPLFAALLAVAACAQAPDVPIHTDAGATTPDPVEAKLTAAAEKLRASGDLLGIPALREQMARPTCELTLPKPRDVALTGPQVWRAARAAFVTIGFHYKCTQCDEWHLDTGGGYAIAANGIVATCRHVIAPNDEEMREGFLFCADDAGNVYPVREVLACDEDSDTAILRTDAVQLVPLPLRTDVVPGETAYSYSEPMGTRGYFSSGIVNRFAYEPIENRPQARIVMNVSTDWAPGSSGAAVMDAFGNAIGHACAISTHGEEIEASEDEKAEDGAAPPSHGQETYMVLHMAVRAADVLARIRPKAAAPQAVPAEAKH